MPTLAQLLDSSLRPAFWKRTSLDSSDFDYDAVGWNHEALDSGKAGLEAEEAFLVYDTTWRDGYANTGHTYGDALSDSDRAAVLEYLKTL